MRIINRIFIFCIIFLIGVSSLNVVYSQSRYNYSFDVSPQIKKQNKKLSFGLAMMVVENNSWAINGEIVFTNANVPNESLRNVFVPHLPYVEYRPFNFLEFALAPILMYKIQDTRNDLSNITNSVDYYSFEGIHFSTKATLIDWYVSIALKVDVDYSFYSDRLPAEPIFDDLDIVGTFMLAIVPKVVPINLLFNYSVHTDSNLLPLGNALVALEFITSDMITLFAGSTFVFPYKKEENDMYYVEPFVKFTISVGDFLQMNSVYRKIVYGSGNKYIPNYSTFQFSIEYLL